MTKKDYELIARALFHSRPSREGKISREEEQLLTAEWKSWHRILAEISFACSQENPNFDKNKFTLFARNNTYRASEN